MKVRRWEGMQGDRDAGYKDTGRQEYRDAGLQGDRVTRLQGYRDTGMQGNKVTRLQGYRVTIVT